MSGAGAGLAHLARYALGAAPKDPKQLVGPSAVLLLVAAGTGGAQVLLIQRAADLRHHGGQMALPGGGWEPKDATLWHTALREAAEEVGLPPGASAPVAVLTPIVIGASGYTVMPFVATATASPPPALRPDAREVAGAWWVPVADLQAARQVVARTRSNGHEGCWPEFHLPVGRVWGATAFMLDEFLHAWGGGRREAWVYRALLAANTEGG